VSSLSAANGKLGLMTGQFFCSYAGLPSLVAASL
jgi:hypothetical protein